MRKRLLISLCLVSKIILSQDSIRKNFFWVELSYFRSSSTPNINLLSGDGGCFTYSSRHDNFFRTRFYATPNDGRDTLYTEKPRPNRLTSIQSVQLEYGRGCRLSRTWIMVAYCGLSCSWGSYRGEIARTVYQPASGGFLFGPTPASTEYYYSNAKFRSIGVPIGINMTWAFLPVMGFGIDVYANINKHPELGLAFNWSLGNIRSKEKKY